MIVLFQQSNFNFLNFFCLYSSVSSYCSLLDNNDLLCGFSPAINELKMLSESQVDENQLIGAGKMSGCTRRRIIRYGVKHVKWIISASFAQLCVILCPFYSILYHNLNCVVILS